MKKSHPDFLTAQSFYSKQGFIIEHIKTDEESQEYGAGSFCISGRKVIFRVSKITPTKTGQFVTIWKRNAAGETQPFDETDDFHYLMIAVNDNNRHGYFIFPKHALAAKGIISSPTQTGKRGIRVYPSWITQLNKQAEKTSEWQRLYFFETTNIHPTGEVLNQYFSKQS